MDHTLRLGARPLLGSHDLSAGIGELARQKQQLTMQALAVGFVEDLESLEYELRKTTVKKGKHVQGLSMTC